MGKYFKTTYEIFKNSRFRAPKKDYDAAINYFVNLMKKANKSYRDVTKGTKLYNERIKKDAIQLVNKILAKGKESIIDFDTSSPSPPYSSGHEGAIHLFFASSF